MEDAFGAAKFVQKEDFVVTNEHVLRLIYHLKMKLLIDKLTLNFPPFLKYLVDFNIALC